MNQVKIQKLNETWFHIEAPPHILKGLSDHFSFEVENLHHIRRQNPRLKFWDGKIRLFRQKEKLLPYGLLKEALQWIREQECEIDYEAPAASVPVVKFDKALYTELVEKAGLTFASDQEKAIQQCLKQQKLLLLSPTASGKSFIIYCVQQHIQRPTLIIVPTVQLVDQMEKDFLSYGFNNDANCIHKLCYGEPRGFHVRDSDIVVGTWQTLRKLPKEFFEQFEVLFGDEVHELEAGEPASVIQHCVNAYYKIGTSGTLRNTKMNMLALQGLFGPVFRAVTTKELMEKGRVAGLKINILVLKYPDKTRELFWKQNPKYEDELQFLFGSLARNTFLTNLVHSLKKNTLVLFQRKEAHGKPLFDLIKEDSGRQYSYVDGDVARAKREEVRGIFEQRDDCTAVASFGTFRRGINIKNLHNLVFASPIKTEITTLQSIGRGLRLNSNKTRAILWDIVDDLSFKGKNNAALGHFYSRMQAYIAEGFEYEIHPVYL